MSRAGLGKARLLLASAAPGSGGGPRAPCRLGCRSGVRVPAAPQRQERLAEAPAAGGGGGGGDAHAPRRSGARGPGSASR